MMSVMKYKKVWLVVLVALANCNLNYANILQVGPHSPYANISGAVSAARDDDTIALEAGQTFLGINGNAGIAINKQLTFTRFGEGNDPIIDLSNANLNLFNINDSITVYINYLIIQNSSVTSPGSAIANNKGSLYCYNCTFSNNSSSYADTVDAVSGAIYSDSSSISIDIESCTFINNKAKGAQSRGGAIGDAGCNSITLNNCLFDNNSSVGIGGAFYGENTRGYVSITSCTFNDNIVGARGFGGAIGFLNCSGSMKIDSCTFNNNRAFNGTGGAVYSQYCTLYIPTCIFNGNSALGGGAIYMLGSSLKTEGCTFNSNSALGGGALFTNLTTVTALSCTFNANGAANGQGGAIYNYKSTVSAQSCTLSHNTASNGNGGGVYNDEGGVFYAYACTFTTNSASNGYGGSLYNLSTATISCSRFMGPDDATAGWAIYSAGGSVSAIDNWWGSNYDPVTMGAINGTVAYTPYVQMATTVNPTIPIPTQTTTITADFTKGSDGRTVPCTVIPDGTLVAFTFSSYEGIINTVQVPTQNGVASTTYTPPSLLYFRVCVALNNSTMCQSITPVDYILADTTGAGNCTNLHDALTLESLPWVQLNHPYPIYLTSGQTFTGSSNAGLTIAGPLLPITFDKHGIGADPIVDLSNTGSNLLTIDFGATVTISNIVIQNGSAAIGGAVNNNGNLYAYNCTFSNNNSTSKSTAGGGAIFNNNTADAYASSCVFNNNTAYLQGGAIFSQGTFYTYGCTFSTNSSGTGGAILTQNNLSIDSCTFDRNTQIGSGGSGGAIQSNYFSSVDINPFVSVKNSVFTNNSVGNYSTGGAICSALKTTMSIDSCIFTNNSVGDDGLGGAIYDNSKNPLVAYGCTFSGNGASNSGGGAFAIISILSSNPSATINCSRFIYNMASTGSSIYIEGGTVDVTNNWWGSSAADPVGTGDIAVKGGTSGTVTWNPSLTMVTTVSPANPVMHQKATAVAAFAGNISSCSIPDNTPVSFSSVPAMTIIPPVAYTLNGTATAAFYPSSTDEMQLCAQLDATTTCKTVTPIIGTLIVDLHGRYQSISSALSAASSGYTILLTAGQTFTGPNNAGLEISNNLTFDKYGSGADPIVDLSNTGSNLFIIDSDVTVTISNIVIKNASTATAGGAILNNGSLYAYSCTFSNNSSTNSSVLPGQGFGGALYNDYLLTVTDCTFISNYARNNGYGGAIGNSGTRASTINCSRFAYNMASTGSSICVNGGSVNAIDNWWGSNSNPYTTGALAVLSGTATYAPYLTMVTTVSPSTVVIGHQATAIADFTKGSDGTTLPCNVIPDNTPVTFSSTGATVTPLVAYTFDGTATATFTPSSPSSFNVCAQFNNSKVCQSVTPINAIIVDNTGAPGTYANLASALNYAVSGNTILLTAGQTFTGSNNAGLEISNNLTFDKYGSGADPIVDLSNTGSNLFIIDSGFTVTISNIVIKNASVVGYGSAIQNLGTLYSYDCTFSNNNCGCSGSYCYSGAVFNYGALTVSGCTFMYNTATKAGGAAIISYNPSASCTMVANNCIFDHNIIAGSQGAGAAIYAVGHVSINGCTFTNNSAYGCLGGALYSTNATTTVANCVFFNNSVGTGQGGAIASSTTSVLYAYGCTFSDNSSSGGKGAGGAIATSGKSFVNNCTFANNDANAGSGGALFSSTGTTNIMSCVFTGNSANEGDGGAITNYDGSSLYAYGCTFTNNSANNRGLGGALYSTNATTTVANCIFVNNSVSTGQGGAITNYTASVLYAYGCTFSDNSASGGNGGAIATFGKSFVNNCTFANNDANAGSGGAIATSGKSFVNNCTFANNDANAGSGGALFSSTGTTNIMSCVFTGNSANEGDGGAITNYDGSSLYAYGCTFTNNSANSGGAFYSYYISNVSTATINCSRFLGNTAVGGSAVYVNKGTANVADNWWGSNDSPSGSIYGTATYAPYLTMVTTLSPSTPHINHQATVTADFTKGSDEKTLPCSVIPDGTPVAFSSTGPTVTPSVAYTLNGVAIAYVTPITATPFNVCAQLNSGQACQTVTPANTIIVDTTGAGDCTNIKSALSAVLSNGTILLTSGQTFTGPNNAGLEISNNLTFDKYGSGADPIVDLSNTGSNLFIIDSDVTVTISNIVIKNASTATAGGAILNGGSLYAYSCTFSNNVSTNSYNGVGFGGALYNNYSLTVTNCTFISNKALTNGWGGGIANDGSGKATVNSCTFINNYASSLGGVLYSSNSTATITNSRFIGNIAADSSNPAVNRDPSGPDSGNDVYVYGCQAFLNNNWYDSTEGPMQGDITSTGGGTIDEGAYLTMVTTITQSKEVTGKRQAIIVGKNTKIIADFRYNSKGDIAIPGIPDATPVKFSVSEGLTRALQIRAVGTSETVGTQNGMAAFSFIPTMAGFGEACAALDLSLQCLDFQAEGPASPRNLQASQKLYRYPRRADLVNTITWQAALDQADPAVAYKIYVSTDVETALATISATQSLSYTQHNIQSGVSITYYVSAVDVYGNESKAASITIP